MRVLCSYCMCESSVTVVSECLKMYSNLQYSHSNSSALRELSYNPKNLKTSCNNMLNHKILHYLLTSLPHIMSFTIEQSGGALVNIAPTKTWVPHMVCLMHLQHPRSSMSKPSCLKRSSVSNSEVLGFESPRNCKGEKEKYKDAINMDSNHWFIDTKIYVSWNTCVACLHVQLETTVQVF